jgi:N-acetylneuraminic acid mutarotase
MRKSRFLNRVFVSMFAVALCGTAAATTSHPSGTCTPPGAWESRTDFPGTIVRAWGTFFPADGKFYLLGGRSIDGAGNEFLQVQIYDPATDTWSASNATFPDGNINNMVGGVLDFGGTPLIVTVGGSLGTNTGDPQVVTTDTRTYDPVGDSLQILTNDPWPGNTDALTLPGGAAVYENKLFVFGGFDVNVGMSDTIWQFDPSAAEGSRWTEMTATLPVPAGYIPTATSNGLIYLLGGSTWDDVNLTILDSDQSLVYDPDADTITPITAIPRPTGETRAVTALDGTVWVLGGGRDAPNPSNEVDVYDPATDTWDTLGPAFVNARRNSAADIDPATGNIWVVGGYDFDGAPSSFNEQFTACSAPDDVIFADGFDGPPPP